MVTDRAYYPPTAGGLVPGATYYEGPDGRPVTADALALLSPDSPDTWPQGILAAADMREQRAKGAAAGHRAPWRQDGRMLIAAGRAGGAHCGVMSDACGVEVAEHIAAEANPAHALAAVRRWRGVVERHARLGLPAAPVCQQCNRDRWPCPDLREVADEARTYLGGEPC